MRNLRYEIRYCTSDASADGKVYTSEHDAQRAADACEHEYGIECYVWELPSR